MALNIYKISEFNHVAKIKLFDDVCKLLADRFDGEFQDGIIVGNYCVEGVEIDAIVITRYGVVTFDFKDGGGNVVAREVGEWILNERTMAGGAYGKSPLVQARMVRNRLEAALKKLFCVPTIIGETSVDAAVVKTSVAEVTKIDVTNVSVVVVFSNPSAIDDSALSDATKKWLAVCDKNHLADIVDKQVCGTQVLSVDYIRNLPNLLHITQFDISQQDKVDFLGIYSPDVATDFFDQILSMPNDVDIRLRYRMLSQIFHQAVDSRLENNNIKFSGFYAKVEYLLSEYKDKMMDKSLAMSINAFRIRTRKLKPRSSRRLVGNEQDEEMVNDAELEKTLARDVAALAKFIGMIFSRPVPEELNHRFPYVADADFRPLYRMGTVMRVVVDCWDDDFIMAKDSESGMEQKIYYHKSDNRYALGDHGYLKDLLQKGDQLNIVVPRIENEIIYPAAIIYNPDYLIDVSSLAACFSEHEIATPYAYLIRKLSPSVNSEAIMLGNFAGQILDEEVYHIKRSYERSLQAFCANNAVNLAVCPLSEQFRQNAEMQKQHIHRAIFETLAEAAIIPYQADGRKTILEPSFYSETLGLQARMDFILKDMTMMVEQKSGKAAYNPSDPATPRVRPEHYVQALLYMAIFRYNYGVPYSNFHSYMLYSKYPNSLLDIATAPGLLFDALKLRNQVAWMELLLSKGGFRMLESLTPEHIYPKESGYVWANYLRPRIEEILSQVHSATQLERDYYYRFLAFVENEQILSKVGNRTKEESGFASTWNSTLEEKRNAGNIYADLSIMPLRKQVNGPIEEVEFLFPEEQDNDMSNFRQGDVVFFYSYDPRKSDEPNPTSHYVFRGSLVDNPGAKSVRVALRNPQTTTEVFDGEVWAIEHDFMESSYRAQFQGLQLFLQAPKSRRDLLMLQRKPEIDETRKLKGDYTNNGNAEFNDLVLRVKQANDLFLIIGPPGTGKTSFGMLNVLKEELLEEGSSVLLLSFTNRAVDEMCSKLVEESIDFIRLGSELGCSEKYRSHLLNKRSEVCRNGEEIQQLIGCCRVFCGTTTAFNTSISLLGIKQFDLAIVDEASQILEPQIIGLLSQKKNRSNECAIKKFVLIGDEKQLPAVVQQQESESRVVEPNLQAINLSDCRLSLFERLIKTYRKNGENNAYSYMLTRQGRMHQDIANFPNYAFYQNKLIPVPLSHQKEPTPSAVDSKNGLDNLLTTRRISFVSYSQPKNMAWEYEVSDKVNINEAKMVAAAVYHIYKLNENNFDKAKTVGVIVPYRNQISSIRNEIDKYGVAILHDIMIDTVERYQGSQCENIVYGFTIKKYYQLNFLTSNQYVDKNSGEIIDRKLNVAMTRAMKHLVMIGDARLLRENIIFYKLMEFAKSRRSYFEIATEDFVNGNFNVDDGERDMKEQGLGGHYFDEKADDNNGDTFERLFNMHVVEHAKADAYSLFPQFIMGNSEATNKALIDYGRINFVSAKICQIDTEDVMGRKLMRTFSARDLVTLYCYNYMQDYYSEAKKMYCSYRNELMEKGLVVSDNIMFIDMGCGPATAGLAFMEVFGDVVSMVEYYGVDTSEAMLEMAEKMMHDGYADKVGIHTVNSLLRLNANFWSAISEVPSVVVFNFSYFFSNVSPTFAENLANQIAQIVNNHPLNKYVFFVLQAQGEESVKSYRVFEKLISMECNQKIIYIRNKGKE